MVTNIGLLDYDVLHTRQYKNPNYDLGLIYAFYRNDKNINIRLISSLSYKNLAQYDKIYIFKQQAALPHPSAYIQNYYQLPIEEYGPGFIEKPLRPFLKETRFLRPDFSCYNTMLMFSLEHPAHKLAWHINKKARGGKYSPIRLYEMLEGEDLKKDFPITKFNMIYDNPVNLMNNKEKWDYYNFLLDQGYRFLFAQSLDISLLSDTNILEQVLNDKKYASIRQTLIATEINDVIDWLVNKIISKECKKVLVISVKLPTHLTVNKCLETMLLMNFFNFKTNYRLRLIPMRDKRYLKDFDLALFAFNYLIDKPYYMSYYEYVFNISYLRMGVPKELIHTGEDRYEYIFQQYGMAPLLVKLEDWIKTHPEYEEAVFIGGDSNYEKQRRKYYDKRRGKYAFGGGSSNLSS